jgi:predicted HicB family RNase H-like nuclease
VSCSGYLASVELDEDERIFRGTLAFIRALVSYEAEGLIQALHDAVDGYPSHCAEQGAAPSLD